MLDHESFGTSTRKPSRTRCPNTSDAPTISPAGSGVVSLRRHAANATGSPKNPASNSRLFISLPQKAQKEFSHKKAHKSQKRFIEKPSTFIKNHFELYVPFCG
jgi:hypothetical protein